MLEFEFKVEVALIPLIVAIDRSLGCSELLGVETGGQCGLVGIDGSGLAWRTMQLLKVI